MCHFKINSQLPYLYLYFFLPYIFPYFLYHVFVAEIIFMGILFNAEPKIFVCSITENVLEQGWHFPCFIPMMGPWH